MTPPPTAAPVPSWSRRASGPEVPRVLRDAKARVGIGPAERELVQAELAEDHGAGLQLLDDRGVVALAQAGSSTRLFAVVGASRGDDVLDADRDALEGAFVDAGREVGVGLAGAASATSSMMRMKAARVSWVAWARASWASVRATEVILPLRSHSAASAIVSGSSGMDGHLAFVQEACDVVRGGRLPHRRGAPARTRPSPRDSGSGTDSRSAG